MQNFRKYGTSPYRVAVIHGGPGAAGQMAPVARELSRHRGVLEPLQTAASVEGQVLELKEVLSAECECPAVLIGSSWGAMLGFIFAARHPAMVRKLIMVGSGPYDEKYAAGIMSLRLSRLSNVEREEVNSLIAKLNDPAVGNKNPLLARFGALFTKTDAFEPITLETETLECDYAIHRSVWEEAAALRSSGEMLAFGKQITCPVVAIHGDYDPHPAEGIKVPLSPVLKDFRFILLEKCGHLPWIERHAKDKFYEILERELPQ